MRKRILSLILCIVLLLSAALPVGAKTVEESNTREFKVTDAAGFLNLAEKCRLDSYSQGLTVILEADIDLTGTDFAGFPIFCGTFQGNGHTIQGLNITRDGSAQGLFRYLAEGAVVQDLILEGTVQPGGSSGEVGGLVGNNAGTIRNCRFNGTVSGNEYIGGLAGNNAINGIIEDCSVLGNIYGGHFVGGVAGKNSGVIRNCINKAQINVTAQQNDVELSDITLESLTSSEAADTVTDVGGIAGTSPGVIRGCENRGDVGYKHMGYNIGGIAGTQSGYITECKNYGKIQGRKEVGGIVGQMEPTALVEYEEDALQILQRQLDGMASIISQTAANVQNTGQALYSQVGAMQYYVGSAQEAVDTLRPQEGEEGIVPPDLDTIQAAKNSISSSMSGMVQTAQGMTAVTESAVGTLSNNLYALQNQINAMRTTLGNVSETLGGSIKDVSDLDTELDLTGKVENCENHGSVLADRNVGGITGAMALENDLDHEEDLKVSGENSLNFESELRCVVRNCENAGTVTAQKQNVGGITGWQSLGLVKNCSNTGTLDAENADHVGGISGESSGYIRECSVKCEIFGADYVGGIAGSATIVISCRSLVRQEDAAERQGAILGMQSEDLTGEEDPVMGNIYLSAGRDLGGIDGVSYAGKAEPMDQKDFLALEDLPDLFRSVTLYFCYENGGEVRFTVPLGEDFPEEKIPSIPEKAGNAGVWEGLEASDLKDLLLDRTFRASYQSRINVIQSQVQRDGMPMLLLQGSFAGDTVVILTESNMTVPQNSGTVLEAWNLNLTEDSDCSARFRMPADADTDRLCLILRGADAVWRETDFTVDGSYLVFDMESGDDVIALVETKADPLPMILAGIALLAVLTGGAVLLRKRKKA